MRKLPVGAVCEDFGCHLFILGAGASRACLPDGDAHGERLPVMNDFVETLQLAPLFEKAGVVWEGRSIEDLWTESAHKDLQQELEEAAWDYFSHLQLPEHSTLYDELVLSLRPKDVIATFNWDPLLPQAYRRAGVITTELPQIVFLHGSVALGVCHDCRVKGFLQDGCCPTCGSRYERSKLPHQQQGVWR